MSHLHKLFICFTMIFISIYLIWVALYEKIDGFYKISILIIFGITWTLTYFCYDLLNFGKIHISDKAVLITGCSSGFGIALAIKLDKMGFYVFAGVLSATDPSAIELISKCSNRLCLVQMDVTNKNEVENVVEGIKKTKLPLWAVVNNAGIAEKCPFDWGNDIDVYRKIFETNVFGLVRVTKNCIPLLRESKGRIVNIASIAGRISVPFLGHYCMSKHSVRAFSDTIRRELFFDNIKVITIEPIYYKTPMLNFENIFNSQQNIYNQTPDIIKFSYDQIYLESLKSIEKVVNYMTRKNIDEVVSTIENAITLKTPRSVYQCNGFFLNYLILIGSHLPEFIVDPIICLLVYPTILFRQNKINNTNNSDFKLNQV